MEITFGYEKNLIICSSTSQLKMAIESSNNEKNIIIPDLEVLPYDNFSPHPEVSSNRLISFRDILKKSSVNVSLLFPLYSNLFLIKPTLITFFLNLRKINLLIEIHYLTILLKMDMRLLI